jgi:hypothetical protein
MANTLITPSVVAREALMALENNLVMANLVYRDYSNEFAKVGDTVSARRPATFQANEFTTSISVQDAVEGYVAVTLDKHLDVSFAVTSKELTLSLNDFSEQFIQPAMRAIAQKIDALILERYVDIPSFVIKSSPNVSAADIANVGALLDSQKAPMDSRVIVMSPFTYAKYIVLDAFLHADKSGSTDALRNASMGKVLNLEGYMDQNVVSHNNGTFAVSSGTLTVASASAGATSITASATACSGTLKKGTLLTIADTPGQYVVTADCTAASNSITIPIYPALQASVTSKAVTIVSNHYANLAFHKNAFAFVTRPLALPLGAANAEVINYNGLAVRAVYDYDINAKKDIISLDILCGVKTLDPNLAVRLVD